MTKFHINKHGIPAPCKAKAGNCPLGGNEQHFDSKEQAQASVDKKHKEEFGILANDEFNKSKNNKIKMVSPYKKLNPIKNKELFEKRKEILRNESEGMTYIERCRGAKRLENYVPVEINTTHYDEDRQAKADELTKNFGEGKLVGHYEVDHIVGKISHSRFKKQVVELLDNGRITIYDKHSGRTITTFMAHRARVETMMILSGEIPDNRFLGRIVDNRNKATKLNLS